jgi:hypothetical protein
VEARRLEELALPDDPELMFDAPTDAPRTVALAHGAGAGTDSPFMEFFAAGLARKGFRVARFEFPYMASRRVTGKQKPPDREPVLRETWLKVVSTLGPKGLVIGGKSMGGRIASLVADEADSQEYEVGGFRAVGDCLVCLGISNNRHSPPAVRERAYANNADSQEYEAGGFRAVGDCTATPYVQGETPDEIRVSIRACGKRAYPVQSVNRWSCPIIARSSPVTADQAQHARPRIER